MSDLAIIGFTRFSVVTSKIKGTFKAIRDAEYDDACRITFNDDRMVHRFALFESITLPTLNSALAGRHDDFHHVVIISSNLPDRWKQRLERLLGVHPWLSILTLTPDDWLGPKTRRAAADLSAGRRHFTFRLDDDDALSTLYLNAIMAHRSAADGTVLSPDAGYFVGHDGITVTATPRHYPLIALGLGLYSAAGAAQTIFDLGAHRSIGERAPVVHVAEFPMWLRTVHYSNDSEQTPPASRTTISGDALEGELRQYFAPLAIAGLEQTLTKPASARAHQPSSPLW